MRKLNLIPYVVEKNYNSERSYDLYSRMLKDRIVFLTGEITDEKASIVVSELLYLDSLSSEEICLYINSPGGSVTAGFSIYDTMNFIKSDVKTIVIGMAASMAAFLLASGTKGKRCSLKNSEIMIHQPLGGAQGQATEIQIAAERIIKMKNKLNNILSTITSKDIETIKNDTERDNYMEPEEALEYGLIDTII